MMVDNGVLQDQNKDLQDIIYNSPNSIDQLLSEELLQLSQKDRNMIEEEVHGVTTLAPIETPTLLEASLQELSLELTKIPEDCKVAYMETQILPKTYVNAKDFRLRFLRCELFDAKKAAMRMVKFLDFAVHLFGPIALERPMKLSDLTKHEKKWMQNLQILPYRDQSGRAVRAWVGDFALNQVSPLSMWRAAFYGMCCMSDDTETQRKGCVGFIWVGSDPQTPPIAWEYFGYHCKYEEASPLRLVSFHFCMPNVDKSHPIHIMRASIAFSLGNSKSRMKFHFGNREELLYKLKSHGIPVECIPVTESGIIKTTYFKKWMRGRNHLEGARETIESKGARPIIILPGSKDVVFRYVTSLKHHPGNVMFESMIEAKLEDHSCASTSEKAAIVKLLIGAIHQSGGRFLVWNKSGWWNELKDVSDIHARIAEKIRRIVVGKRNAQEQQICRSSTFAFSGQDNVKRRKISSGCNENENCDCFFEENPFHEIHVD